jgi:hypothetical protein
MRFSDRARADHLLATRLDHLRGQDVVVLAVPLAREWFTGHLASSARPSA